MKLANIVAGLAEFRRSLVNYPSDRFAQLKTLAALPKLASDEVRPLLADNNVTAYEGTFKKKGDEFFITVVSGKKGTAAAFGDFTAYNKKGEAVATLKQQPLWDDLAE